MFLWLNRLWQTVWQTMCWLFESLSLVPGFWNVFKLRPPRVTFFGGAKLSLDDPYAEAARKLAALLVANNISIITGGGAGIMEAAAIGAKEAKLDARVNNLGIGLDGLEEGAIPEVHGSFIRVKKFVMRKWLMINFSSAHIVFPGGVGTYDELAEILMLMDTGKLKRSPMILYGKDYWDKLAAWIDDGLKRGFINPNVEEFFVIADNVSQAFDLICEVCETRGFKIER